MSWFILDILKSGKKKHLLIIAIFEIKLSVHFFNMNTLTSFLLSPPFLWRQEFYYIVQASFELTVAQAGLDGLHSLCAMIVGT